jgi:ABC-type dipeptide/oligopeptide/nickel transport system permease component
MNSFKLLLISLIIALVLGIGLGMRNGLKRSKIRTFMELMVFSIPDVVISLGALYSIVYWFKDISISATVLRAVIMPRIAMIIIPAIYIARIIEVAVIEEKDKPYIYGAIARGVSQWGVIWRHIFPKVLSKLFDTMGVVIRIGIINLIVVEYIFSVVGIGNYVMHNYRNTFFVIYISFGFGVMYFVLTLFFKLFSWILNPLKRRIS